MSLVNLAHVCSHLQNASKARLGLTSIPYSKMHLSLALGLQKQGLISHVIRAGPDPPDLLKLHEPPEPLTQQNVASRRLWLGLKYWNGQPVISKMSLISKPTRRVWMDKYGLSRLARGADHNYVKGLREVGEVMFVTTSKGVMDARECIERDMGGMLLCRVL